MGDLAAVDAYGMTPEQWAALSGPGVPWHTDPIVAGAAKIAAAPGQAYQSTPDNPITTEQMIKPGADLGMMIVGSGYGMAPEGSLGMAGARMRPRPRMSELAAQDEYIPPAGIGHNMPPEPIEGGQAPYLYHVSSADNLAGIGSGGLNKGTFFATEAPSHIGNVELQQQFPTFRTIQSGDFKPEGNRGPLHPDFISTAKISPNNLEMLQGDKWVPFGQSPPAYSYGAWSKDLPRSAPADVSTEVPSIRGLSTKDAIAQARQQPHLIKAGEQSEGYYIGSPRDWEGKRDLTTARKGFDEYVQADPRGGDWYDRYRAAVNEVTGGDPVQNKWMSNQEGQWSAGVDPGSEVHFALKENNAAIAGMPVKAARPAQHEAHLAAVEAKDPNLYQLGDKTGEYANLVNPDQVNPPGATGVNDFRHARNWGYTEASGSAQKNAMTPAQHTFMDYETALAVDRANKANLGGRSDWTGEQLQAAPWVRQKALDFMARNPALTYDEAFARANRTIGDFFDRHTYFATHEAQPGADTGHMMGSLAAGADRRAAFAADPASTWATAPGGRDAIYAGLGVPGTGVNMRVRPTIDMQGMYTTPSGAVETNPGFVARPLGTFTTGKGADFKSVTPADRALLNAGEAVRALTDAQNAGAWHKIWRGGPVGESNSLFYPRSGPAAMGDLYGIQKAGTPHGLSDVADTGQGITSTSFYPRPTGGKAFDKAVRSGEFGKFGEPERVKVDSDIVDYVDAMKKGVGSQAATRQMMEYLNVTPEIRTAFNNNPYIAERALAKLERDQTWSKEWGAPREDIQNFRRIVGSGPGWVDRMEAALKAGAILPAAAAAFFAAARHSSQEVGREGS
jgi:hypothetical protein